MVRRFKFLILFFALLVLADLGLSRSGIPIQSDAYVLGYRNFYETAHRTMGQKRIILLGGSSLVWGVSAERISMDSGVLTLNAGIHAGIGYRHFFRLASDVLDPEHDLIVISPELELPSLDGFLKRRRLFCEVANFALHKYPLECVGYTLNKLTFGFRRLLRTEEADNDYRRSGFNQYGDFVFRRTGINMAGKIRPNEACDKIELDNPLDEYIRYHQGLEKAGFKVVYIPNFLPRTACAEVERLTAFHEALFSAFGIPGFAHAQQLFEEQLFYDTTYHLTTDGVTQKTEMFLLQLQQLIETCSTWHC